VLGIIHVPSSYSSKVISIYRTVKKKHRHKSVFLNYSVSYHGSSFRSRQILIRFSLSGCEGWYRFFWALRRGVPVLLSMVDGPSIMSHPVGVSETDFISIGVGRAFETAKLSGGRWIRRVSPSKNFPIKIFFTPQFNNVSYTSQNTPTLSVICYINPTKKPQTFPGLNWSKQSSTNNTLSF